MDFDAIAKRVNWKTTGCAVAFMACSAAGSMFPRVEPACKMLETLLVGLGILSSADAGRVQNVVAAVDTLLWKNKLDPETLRPLSPGTVGIGGEAPLETSVTVIEKPSGV